LWGGQNSDKKLDAARSAAAASGSEFNATFVLWEHQRLIQKLEQRWVA
jgi:hypothetical protein